MSRKEAENAALGQKVSLSQRDVEEKMAKLNGKNEELSTLLAQQTSEKERKLAQHEERLTSLTNLCATLEKEKNAEVQKNQSQRTTIDQLRTQLENKGESVKQDTEDYFRLFVQSQDDLKQLTLELEETKSKLAVSLSEEASPKAELIDQSADLKDEIKSLKAALVIARRNVEQLELEKHNLGEEHKNHIAGIQLAAQKQTKASEDRASEKLAEFEAKIAAMREKSQKILEDKDNEIELMRIEQQKEQPTENDSFNQLLQNGDQNLDTALIMYAEQLARKDVEINSHRSRRKELEDRIRSLQDKLVESHSEAADLREKINAEERDKSPASKEYLRNLVMQFLAVPDGSKKKAMLSALETILEFNKEDIKQLKKNWKR